MNNVTMNKIKALLKILFTSESEKQKSMKIIIDYYFDAGMKATKASWTHTHGFDDDLIEKKKQELLKQL